MMIVPGCPNAVMMAGWVDPLDEFGKIDRSVRLRAAATASLSRTIGVPTSQNVWTFSGWVKRSKFSAEQGIFSGGNGTQSGGVRFDATDKLYYMGALEGSGANYGAFLSDGVYRDPGSHAHLVVNFDTARTGNDKLRAFINGVAIPGTNPVAIGATQYTNISGGVHRIGNNEYLSPAWWLDGYISQFAFVDGQALAPSAFGLFHQRTGQWRPRSNAAIRSSVAVGGGARNGWGTNGWLLPFNDTTSLTTLGYDRSQSDTDTAGNNFTASNIGLTTGVTYDSMLDTPTNNFPTWDRLDPVVVAGQSTLTNGNLTLATNTMYLGYNGAHSNIPFPAGKWYSEFTITGNAGGVAIGLDFGNEQRTNYYPGTTATDYAYRQDGLKATNGSNTAYGNAFTAGDVIGILFDSISNKLYFSKNGVVQNSGDPIAGTGFAFSGMPTNALPTVWAGDQSGTAGYYNVIDANFGQRAFSFSPPTGFKALCTKNLPINPAGPMKSSSAFVAVTDTGANIAATLAVARAGWPGYIDIIKRRDPTAEGWRWIFSDDPTNYIDTSNAATAKAAVPAFSGTSYVGYSLRVSASNGVATGTFVHTNGVADTISDGLSNARKMVILHRESAGGGAFYTYHPDLTAGKLLYLDTTAAETADTSISSVTASGFTAAAALPSGTYRWIALAEMDGGIRLGKYAANGTTDNAFVPSGLSPLLALTKNTAAVTNWPLHDAARNAYNPAATALYLNATAGDTAGNSTLDLLSNGHKVRAVDGSVGTNAVSYVCLLIAAFPFRYANAR